MSEHIAKRDVFMGGALIYGGSPVKAELIPKEFEKHFEGFDEKPAKAQKPKKIEKPAKDSVKDDF